MNARRILVFVLLLFALGIPTATATTAASAASVPGGSGAAPDVPRTPEGDRIRAFLAMSAKGDTASAREFVEKNSSEAARKAVPLERRVERIGARAAQLGPLELVRIVAAADGAAKFVARSGKNGQELTVTLELDPSPARGIRGIRAEAGGDPDDDGGGDGPPDAAEKPKGSDPEVAAATDAWLAKLAADDEFSGVVLLARGDTPFYSKAFGLADRDRRVPNTLDTKFNIASIGKAFTSAAVARLVREGRLSWSETIANVLPGSKLPSAGRITVAQLLDMTSGLGDIFGPQFAAADKGRIRELSDYLPLFEKKPLRFEPGKGREYSNAGYVVLGLMIEKVTGKRYRDYVKEVVFTPAGMGDTGFFAVDEPTPKRATGYTRRRESRSETGPRRPNTDTLPGRGSSAGGAYSTAGDLLRFASALKRGDLELASPGREPAAKGSPPRPATGSEAVAGGSPGTNAVLEADFENGTTIIVLANDDPPIAEKTGRRIRQWMAK